MNQIWSLLGEDIVNVPAAGKITLATFGRRAEAEKRNNVSSIRVEDLLIGRVGRCSDFFGFHGVCDVFDVRDHRRLSVLQSRVLLATTDIPDVRRHASIDDDVIFSRVVIDAQSPEDKEASAVMDLLRELPQDGAEGRQWERRLVDVAQRLIESCTFGGQICRLD